MKTVMSLPVEMSLATGKTTVPEYSFAGILPAFMLLGWYFFSGDHIPGANGYIHDSSTSRRAFYKMKDQQEL